LNILFIPHVPNLKVVNRVYEFAKQTNGYFLYWHMENATLKDKVLSQVKSFKFRKKNENIVQIPILFKPEKIAILINTYFLNILIERLHIDVVVNANALLFDVEKIKVPVIYDLVDDHLEINPDIGLNINRINKIKKDIQNSVGVVCVTEFLAEKVKSLNDNVITIENGIDLEKFKNAKSLKKELNLEHKKVFGYIGGVAKWSGLKEAIENYLKIKTSDTAFLVVGESKEEYFLNLKQKYANDILFIGAVSPDEVGNYFKSIDIGLIPFYLNDFTNNAFPIKALEYLASGSQVISTPLKYLKYKKLPFIKFCEINNFYKCMNDIQIKKIEIDLEEYSWDNLSNKLIKFIKSSI
jgi:glycosyltransferase involved in cell wall biosynthesis